MTMRRVVAGLDSDGKEAFLSDMPVQELLNANTVVSSVWRTDGDLQIPPKADFQDGFAFPSPGGSLILSWTAPPNSIVGEEATTEQIKAGEMPKGGAHSTDSIDVHIVLEGQMVFQLPDGSETVLERGDLLVVNGVMHSWYNRGDEPARVLSVVYGAQRSNG